MVVHYGDDNFVRCRVIRDSGYSVVGLGDGVLVLSGCGVLDGSEDCGQIILRCGLLDLAVGCSFRHRCFSDRCQCKCEALRLAPVVDRLRRLQLRIAFCCILILKFYTCKCITSVIRYLQRSVTVVLYPDGYGLLTEVICDSVLRRILGCYSCRYFLLDRVRELFVLLTSRLICLGQVGKRIADLVELCLSVGIIRLHISALRCLSSALFKAKSTFF